MSGAKTGGASKSINLALQGGGAHGAFTWGVLDRLLDEKRLTIAAITGTSAGAMNGAAFKSGMVTAGREGARENLNWLWSQIGATDASGLSDWMHGSAASVSRAFEMSPAFAAIDLSSRVMSPYALGPWYKNPLARIAEAFRYDTVCADEGPALFVCATNVRSGKIRVFDHDDICPEAIMASACLPTLFKAVEIFDPNTGRDEAYWDGGYTGNPALFPLFQGALPSDIIVVNINPLHREELPVSAQAIQNRINEISFNSSLLRELRAIEFVQRLLGDRTISESTMKAINVHMIADDPLMNELSVATKLLPSSYVLGQLKEAGQRAADQFLTDHWGDIGVKSSVDLPAMFN